MLDSPSSLPDAISRKVALITNVQVNDGDESCCIDALERVGPTAVYKPVLFVPREKLTTNDKLYIAFGAAILGRIQGTTPASGRIIRGREFKASRVELASLSKTIRNTVGHVRTFQKAENAPPLLLNRHCGECEFRQKCRAAAVEKDNLSLLGGLSPKEIARLHSRGIFTVIQYSYSFQPRRMKRIEERSGRKHDHSLQALAIRENTVYVAKKPKLMNGKIPLYLDVEGLSDDGWYYLIGLTIPEGSSRRQLSLWAND